MTLKIYMKSGNVLKVDKVEEWEARYKEDNITYLSVTQTTKGFFKCKNELKVGTVSLNQIEAIIQTI
jgi:hypothetical protein